MTYASAAYVTGYVQKKISKYDNPDHYDRLDLDTGEIISLQPEYAFMSKRPAIARKWIERYWTDIYPRDRVILNGRETKPPRYYDKFMDKHQPDIMETVRNKRWDELEDKSKYQLASEKANHEARSRLFNPRNAL